MIKFGLAGFCRTRLGDAGLGRAAPRFANQSKYMEHGGYRLDRDWGLLLEFNTLWVLDRSDAFADLNVRGEFVFISSCCVEG